jgi:hypothetical protein
MGTAKLHMEKVSRHPKKQAVAKVLVCLFQNTSGERRLWRIIPQFGHLREIKLGTPLTPTEEKC